jgi:hypothetical protein
MSSSIFFDRTFDKNRLKDLVRWTFQYYGFERVIELSERLKNIGFCIATQAGLSLGTEDLLIPKEKRWVTRLTEIKVKKNKMYERFGISTSLESNQSLVKTWAAASESLKNAILNTFQEEDPLNPLYLIAFSGARGNLTQIRQLIGIRGLIVDPMGRLVEYPIRSNFKEGIILTEFLLSCYGARKGIVDTALRTARAGYLTRRLIDIAHFQVVSIQDCNTRRGIKLFPLINRQSQILIPLVQRRKGRALAQPLPGFGPRNLFLNVSLTQQVRKEYPNALFRSSLICRAPFLSALATQTYTTLYKKSSLLLSNSSKIQNKRRYFTLCQYCYGWYLADGSLVNIGEAVGILAAQSIGEPGTQLTIRTFHTGGVFLGGISDTLRRPINGQAFFQKVLKGRLARSRAGQVGFLTRESGSILIKIDIETTIQSSDILSLKDKNFQTEKYLCLEQKVFLPKGILLLVRHGQWVAIGSILAFIGPKEFLREGELQVRTYRSPHGRELLFENVYLKRLFLSIGKSEIRKTKTKKPNLPLFPLKSLKRIRTREFSHLLLRAAEPLGKNQNLTHPFLFPWKDGDFRRRYSSLVKINTRKSVDSFIVGKALSFHSLKNRESKQNAFQGSRLSFLKGLYFFFSREKTYRSFFQKKKISPIIFWTIRPKRVFTRLGFNQKKYKKTDLIRIERKEEKRIFGVLSFPSLEIFFSKKFLQKNKSFFRSFGEIRAFKINLKEIPVKEKENFLSSLFILNQIKRPKISFFQLKEQENDTVPYYPRNYYFYVPCILVSPKKPRNFIYRKIKTKNQKNKQILSFFPKVSFLTEEKRLTKNWVFLKHPWFRYSNLIFFPKKNKKTTLVGLIFSCNVPTLRKKQAFFLNKVERNWKVTRTLLSSWFLLKNKNLEVFATLKISTSFFLKNISFLGVINFYLRTTRKILVSNHLDLSGNIKKESFSSSHWSLKRIQQKWKYTFKPFESGASLYFLTKNPTEVHQNSTSQEFFLLPKDQLKAYNPPTNKYPLFLGYWQRTPRQMRGKIGPREIGQRIALERNLLIIRCGTRIFLEIDSFFPWQPGSIFNCQRPLTSNRGQTIETGDITSGILQIESLLEVRTQTGIPQFLESLYQRFLHNGFTNRVATRKAIHYRQRILVDGVQRIYRTNGVSLDDKHLELIVRPMAFVKVISDQTHENPIIQGENYPLEILERVNWNRILKNWRKNNLLRECEPRVIYKPLLLGLTKGALRNASFLSAASFQETSRVLARASLRRRIDCLLGLKENLILGTRLPIGTNARFLISNILFEYKLSDKSRKFKALQPMKKKYSTLYRKSSFLWLDALCYLEGNALFREEDLFPSTLINRRMKTDQKYVK